MSKEANNSGGDLEFFVESLLRRYSVSFKRHCKTGVIDDLGKDITPDFYVEDKRFERSFFIECKFQDSEGSIIDKLPLTKDRAIMLPHPLLVVSDGELHANIIDYFFRMHRYHPEHILMPTTFIAFASYVRKSSSGIRPKGFMSKFNEKQKTMFK